MPKKPTIARLEKGGEKFEILVDADLALEMKMGKSVSIDKVLLYDMVYKDAKKGIRASEESLRKVFGTTDVRKIAEIIIKQGEILLTAEQRRKLMEEKRKQVIEWLSRNTIDPRTKLPHPPTRIELALKQAKVGIDPLKPVEEQIPNILKALQKILPIKVATAVMEVSVGPQYAGKVASALRKLGNVVDEKWLPNGFYVAKVEIPAGMQEQFINKINSITKGSASVRLVETKT